MSDIPSRAQLEASFQRLLENYDGHDIGLDMFNDRLRRLEDNANDDIGSFSDIIEPGVEMLNDEWLYHDEVAVVTGRVYVVDGTVIDRLTERFGDPIKDAQGHTFFFVENCELRSYGIQDGMHGRRIDESRITAKIGYGFTLPDEDAQFAQLLLYPGEASRHEYPLPTPEAIDMILHRRWPEKMKIIDSLLSSDSKDIELLPRRLGAIVRQVQSELAESAEAREWLSIYINERLKLNTVWPYRISVNDTLLHPDDELGTNWIEMDIDGTLQLDIKKPRIELMREGEAIDVRAMLYAELPDDQDEWGGMPIGVDVRNIERMKGTLSRQALFERAFAAYERKIEAGLAADYDDQLHDQNEAALGIRPRRIDNHGGEPANIREMRLLQSEIEAMIDMVRPIGKKEYDTLEQALEVSASITHMISDRLIGAGIANFVMAFEGEQAERAVSMKALDRQVAPGETVIRVDPERPFVKLQHGDRFTGTFYAFHGDVVSVEDDDGQTVSFKIVPRLIVDTTSSSTVPLTYSQVPMIEVLVQQRAMIPLDGSVEITIPSLERHEADTAARSAVARAFSGRHIATRVHRLFSAFQNETDSMYQSLNRIDDVRALARYVESEEKDHLIVFEALNSLLMNRSVMATGTISGHTDDTIRFVDGIVADINVVLPAIDQRGPHITIIDKQDGEHVSLRLSSLQSLAF